MQSEKIIATILIQSEYKKKMKLVIEIAKLLGIRAKKLSFAGMEDLAIARSIKKGRQSGRSTKNKILKALHCN